MKTESQRNSYYSMQHYTPVLLYATIILYSNSLLHTCLTKILNIV